MSDISTNTCCICGKKFTGYGNDPYPVVDDNSSRCCDECNMSKVIPIRQRLDAKIPDREKSYISLDDLMAGRY